MKTFKVKLIVNRKKTERILSANSKEEARDLAGMGGAQVLSISEERSGGRFDRMSVSDRVVFFQRLSSMLASKVGASEALDVVVRSFSGTVRDAARKLLDHLGTGGDMSEAMAACGSRYFPETVVAIVRTGAKGGDLAYALREAARFERELEEVRKTSSKGIYSAFGGFLVGLLTILASTLYVAPMIMNSSLVKVASDQVNIGWVMTMANITTYLACFMAVVVLSLFFLGVVLRPFAPALVDRMVLRIPFYRDMMLAKSNYLVFFGLGVLLKAGLRVEEAIELTIETAPKGELRNDFERALEAIVKGSSVPWPYVMTMLHATDKAALATAQDRTQTARTIEELSLQYQEIYSQRLGVFVPVMQGLSAILLSIAGFVLFAVSTIPLLQVMTAVMKMM